MREDVSRLAGVVSHVAERRIARTRATAEITMRDHPLATVSLALVAGFLVGLAVIPRREQREHGMLSGLRSGMRDWELPDLSRYAPRMPAASSISAEPITSRLEQVLDSLSRVDTGSIASPAMEKLKDWYGTFMSKVRS